MRASVILLLLIVLLALGLRLYRLDAQSLWYDEGFSVYLARMDLAEITARTAADIQPPLYYYLLHAWIGLLGSGENALRSLSALFGVLTVPLAYGVAWLLFRSRLASLLAALLVAVSPLHIWYSQEVRMYTLLTFLCLLSSYFLLLLAKRSSPLSLGQEPEALWSQSAGGSGGKEEILLWFAFTLTSVAALYTHYFAFFVLAFQAFYLLLIWGGWGFRPARFVLGGLISGVITILAYLPWLSNLLTRLGADVSYWPGQLKLPEVLLDVILSFVGGESIVEQVGILLGIGYGLLFALCFIALLSQASSQPELAQGGTATLAEGRTRSHDIPSPPPDALPATVQALPPSYYPLLFLLLYLFLPPALILALSYNAPKFNARYLMVSHPAFLFILAGGLAALWQRRVGALGSVLRGALSALALIFVLGVSAYANYNAYTDPAFARADFRGVARYVQRHIAPDETIILSSGHMFPVFDYYAPGVERHLLPDSPTLDTTRTLDYSIAIDLNRWLAGRGGVWLVLWQDEVVDPSGYLTAILTEEGEEQPVDGTFAKVSLRHYRLPADTLFSDQPNIAHPADFNFGNRLRLLGYTQTGDRQVILFWQALQPLNEDYRVSLILRDTLGQSWGQWDGRPTSYLYPTDRWRVGEIIFGRYDLALLPGSPPGDYGLDVGVYTEADPIGLDVLDVAGAPQGKRAMLGAVRLSVSAATAEEVETPNPIQIDLGGGVALLGWDLDQDQAQPGDRLLLIPVWSVQSQPQGDYRLRVLITDAAGQTWDAGTFPPTNIWHPTSIWLPGQAWRGQSTFRLPIQIQPGEVRLSVQLLDAAGLPLGPAADLTTIQVLPTSRVFTPPQPQAPRQTNFGDQVALLGADLGPDPVAPGGVLRLLLYWQALVEMDVPYSVFVHLLGPDGQVLVGHDGEPVSGTRPTTGWVPGEFIADPHDLSIPVDLPPGEYVIEVGLYDAGAPKMPRLLILGEEGQVETDRVIFGPVGVR